MCIRDRLIVLAYSDKDHCQYPMDFNVNLEDIQCTYIVYADNFCNLVSAVIVKTGTIILLMFMPLMDLQYYVQYLIMADNTYLQMGGEHI